MRWRTLAGALAFWSFASAVSAQVQVAGQVVFDGTPPAPESVSVASDVPTCGQAKEVHKLRLGAGQGVADAVVVLRGAAGAVAAADGRLDQVDCEFVPHVQVISVGSTLKVTSSDPVLHNAHGFYEDGSTAFNLAVPIAGIELPFKASQPGVIKLRCDAGHTWMSAYVVVTDSAFFTLTDADGQFAFSGLPTGSYELEVWHEWLGKTAQPITVSPGAPPVQVTLKKS